MQQSQSDTTNLLLMSWLFIAVVVALVLPPVQIILISIYMLLIVAISFPFAYFFNKDALLALIQSALYLMNNSIHASSSYVKEVINYVLQMEHVLWPASSATVLVVLLPLLYYSYKSVTLERRYKILSQRRTIQEKIYSSDDSPLEKAVAILKAYKMIDDKTARQINTFDDLLDVYKKVRKKYAFPPNVLARCYPYGSEERVKLLNVGRTNKIITHERES